MTQDDVGDRLLVFKTPYLLGSSPEIGDIVIIDSRVNRTRTLKDDIFESPLIAMVMDADHVEEVNWVKRVVGMPGDEIEVKDGQLYRNGQPVEESYIKEKMNSDFEAVTVPEDTIFVLGDNRNHSSDSRVIGPVPIENVLGKVVLRFYPFNRMNVF
ncbi:hypothetical protein GCM10008967_17400 [Bacillus carboniphilus]|uniref:Signal peptidase I n=2 Tax=Bacillus carboniphilus TaxID=86663 RepID=A0ABP3FVH3_9BACI